LAGGHLYSTPLHTAKEEEEGWLGLTDVEAKCRALLLYRMWTQSERVGEITAEWHRYWNLNTPRENLPHVQRIPKSLDYLRIYALEMEYVEPPQQSEALRAFGTRVYETLRSIQITTNKPRDVRITLLYPPQTGIGYGCTFLPPGRRTPLRRTGIG
jgi:hypothetical protein